MPLPEKFSSKKYYNVNLFFGEGCGALQLQRRWLRKKVIAFYVTMKINDSQIHRNHMKSMIRKYICILHVEDTV